MYVKEPHAVVTMTYAYYKLHTEPFWTGLKADGLVGWLFKRPRLYCFNHTEFRLFIYCKLQ